MNDPLDILEADDAARERAQQSTISDFASKVRGVELSWLSSAPEPRDWLVTFQDEVEGTDDKEKRRRKKGFLARGQLHVLAGEGGAGKGRFAMQLALCIAAADKDTLSSRLSLDAHPTDGRVLLLVGEDDEHEIHQRLFGAQRVERLSTEQADRAAGRIRWRSFHGETFRLVVQEGPAGVMAAPDLHSLRAYLSENGPWSLIVIDPLARFQGVEENDNTAMHAAAAEIEKLCDVPGKPAVLVVAHTKKPDKNGGPLTQHDVRGASAVVNAARVVVVFDPSKNATEYVSGDGKIIDKDGAEAREITANGVALLQVKNNLSAKGDELALRFDLDGGLRVETMQEATERRKRQWRKAKPRDDNGSKKPVDGKTTKKITDAGRDL